MKFSREERRKLRRERRIARRKSYEVRHIKRIELLRKIRHEKRL